TSSRTTPTRSITSCSTTWNWRRNWNGRCERSSRRRAGWGRWKPRRPLLNPRPFRLLLTLHKTVIAIDRKNVAVPRLFLQVRPGHGHFDHLVRCAQAKYKSPVSRRSVAAAALGEPCLRPSVRLQAHLRPHHIGMVLANQLDAEPVRPFHRRHIL